MSLADITWLTGYTLFSSWIVMTKLARRRPSPSASTAMLVARVYLRVSTVEQDLRRQEQIVKDAKAAGYYVAGVYREFASGARPELLRMVADLQPGEVIIAEKIDRISRLRLEEAERLVAAIREKGARLVVPGVVDLSEIVSESKGGFSRCA